MTDVDPETQMGICSRCGPVKAYASQQPDGRRWRCSNRVNAQPSVRASRNIASMDADRRERHQATKLRSRGIDITVEQWRELKVAAGGCCQLCGREAKLVVDHDHDTGVVRGLLCSTCNTGLGKFGDSVEALERAVVYLQVNRGCAEVSSES